MLSITIHAVTTSRQRFILAGEAEYLERLSRFAKVKLNDLKSHEKTCPTPELAKERETKELLTKVPANAYLIVLDQRGQLCTSEGLADFIQARMNQGHSQLHFAIGGSFGWTETALKRANYVWSLSPLTFTAQFARLLLLEQLYRAGTILNGQSYHK